MSLTNKFRMAMAMFEIPVLGVFNGFMVALLFEK